MNRDMYYFFRDRLEIDKMIYAITSEDFIAASGEFRVLMKEDRLPEAVKVERYKKEEEKTETSEDRVKALFGEDNVEIIGG